MGLPFFNPPGLAFYIVGGGWVAENRWLRFSFLGCGPWISYKNWWRDVEWNKRQYVCLLECWKSATTWKTFFKNLAQEHHPSNSWAVRTDMSPKTMNCLTSAMPRFHQGLLFRMAKKLLRQGPMVSPSATENAGPVCCGTYPGLIAPAKRRCNQAPKIEKVIKSLHLKQKQLRRVHTPSKEPWYGANTFLASHNHSLFAMFNHIMQSC